MSQSLRLYVILGGLLLLACVAFVVYGFYITKRKKMIDEAYSKYQNAIKDKNKSFALQLGREYYSLVRSGELTIYDEQAIANDISII